MPDASPIVICLHSAFDGRRVTTHWQHAPLHAEVEHLCGFRAGVSGAERTYSLITGTCGSPGPIWTPPGSTNARWRPIKP
jgi:hypothetical protein